MKQSTTSTGTPASGQASTSRRTFLRGAAGAALALPWLESLAVASPRAVQPPTRMAIYYVPIGVVRRGFFPGEAAGAIPEFSSTPEGLSRNKTISVGLHPLEQLTPTLEPLAAVKDKVTLITGLDRFYQHGTDVHAQCASCFLTSATPNTIETSVYPLARSLDHIVADHVGDATPFRTLELSCNTFQDNKESIYFDNISWYGTGHVAPSLRDPRQVYRRLFGTEEIDAYRNITDLVLDDARSMRKKLARTDRHKFAEFIDGIRTIEQQMDKLEQMKDTLKDAAIEEPPQSYLPRGPYIRLMGDLMVAALQTGLTNVATLMIGPERWDSAQMYETLFDKPMSHHVMSHDQKKYIGHLLKVDRFYMEQFAYLVDKMGGIEEANGTSLLDNTIFTYGSGLGDGATHQYTELPIIVAGSGGGRLQTGKHLHCSGGTPLSNLWLTQAQAMGVPHDRFADSTSAIGPLLASG